MVHGVLIRIIFLESAEITLNLSVEPYCKIVFI